MGGKGHVADIGCGPGHVARYLKDRRVDVFGVDLSFAMLARAAALNTDIEFAQGDMRSLAIADDALAGVIAFYSIIHIPRDEVVSVLGELHRVLCLSGELVVAVHVGSEVVHLDEWWGHAVSADFVFFESDEIAQYLRDAGFEIDEMLVREPYDGVEHPSRRAYLLAHKPS
jgi:SAM-dependent methyltransferase